MNQVSASPAPVDVPVPPPVPPPPPPVTAATSSASRLTLPESALVNLYAMACVPALSVTVDTCVAHVSQLAVAGKLTEPAEVPSTNSVSVLAAPVPLA